MPRNNRMRWQPFVAPSAPILHAPVAQSNYILGPFANLQQDGQPIVELKTRLHVNANIKGVQYGLKNIAANTVSIAGKRTKQKTPLTSTGALGIPVVATQSLQTGPTY